MFPWDLRKKGREGGALGIDCCEAWADWGGRDLD